MCCNGILFNTVRLQPTDSPQALAALGLKLKKKNRNHFIQQPCPAHQGDGCKVYEDRPARCRLFVCRQLKAVLAGETTESKAMDTIRETLEQVEQVARLFEEVGETNARQPFTKRYEQTMAQPIDLEAGDDASELRGKLLIEMQELMKRLDRDFRE